MRHRGDAYGELLEHAPTAMPEGGSCIGRRMVCSEWDFASAIRAIGELKRSLRNGTADCGGCLSG